MPGNGSLGLSGLRFWLPFRDSMESAVRVGDLADVKVDLRLSELLSRVGTAEQTSPTFSITVIWIVNSRKAPTA